MTLKTKTISVLTTTRADFGLLRPTIARLQESSDFNLDLIVGGNHVSEDYGFTLNEIKATKIRIGKVIDLPIENATPESLTNYSGLFLKELGHHFTNQKPDLLFVLGDRFEILAAAFAATIHGIPIAHAHGGEITAGAIDDQIRNAVTKLAHLHFTSHDENSKRILKMAENETFIHNVGAFGFESIQNLQLLSKQELEQDLSFKFDTPVCILTFHPETLQKEQTIHNLKSLLSSLKSVKELKIIATYPNADHLGLEFIQELKTFQKEEGDRVLLIPSLGQLRYLSCLKYIDFVIGNSSSGIIEVPSFSIPTLNIGNRQEGRLGSKSIIHVKSNKEAITKAIWRALSDDFKEQCKAFQNPYEKPNTSQHVIEVLRNTKLEDLIALKNKMSLTK